MILIISLDIDGVVAQPYNRLIEIVKQKYNVDVTLDEITKWDWLPEKIGKTEASWAYREMWADWETMPLMEEDTLESVRQLRELGQVFIVTVRQGISDTLRVISWLNKQQIGMDGFLFSTFASGWDKARFSFFDVIIDDAPAAIIGAIERGKIGVVYTHPWNLDLPPEINSKAIRVSSLRDAVKELKKL